MPTDDNKNPLELIERIYDAALAPDLWPRFLDGLVRSLDSTTGVIYSLDTKTFASRFIAHHGLSEREMRDYETYYAAKDPWNPEMVKAPLGNLFFSHRETPDRVLTRTEFYNDVLKPQDLHYATGGPFSRVGDTFYFVGVQRSRTGGPYDEKAGVLRHIFGHMDRAMRLQRRLEELENRESAGFRALDHLSTGVILLNGSARVIFMNRAAERAVDSKRAGISVRNRRLCAGHARADSTLQHLIRSCMELGQNIQTELHPFLSIPCKGGPSTVTVFVSPVSNHISLLGETHSHVRAVVFLRDSRQKTASMEAIRVLYELTPTQSLLVEKLIEGKSLENAANELGVTKETSRTHLKNIFRKTGTRRQSELITLVTSGISASIRSRD